MDPQTVWNTFLFTYLLTGEPIAIIGKHAPDDIRTAHVNTTTVGPVFQGRRVHITCAVGSCQHNHDGQVIQGGRGHNTC